MDPERWRQIDALFGAALDVPSEKQPSFLARACVDESMRLEVEALLAAEGDLDHFLETPAAGGELDVQGGGDPVGNDTLGNDTLGPEPSAPDPIGATLGPYRIEREIDRGGMGAGSRSKCCGPRCDPPP